MIRRPEDPYEDLSKEELKQKYDEFGENNFSKDEENDLIFSALKTLLPPVLAVCAIFAIMVLIIGAIFFR